MTSTDRPKRGEIWLAALGALRPGEPGKTRPVLVITPEELALDSPRDLVAIVPISASVKPTKLSPPLTGDGLDEPSAAVTRGIRGLARPRMIKKIGEIDTHDQRAVDQALLITLGLIRLR